MNIQRFVAPDMRQAIGQVRAEHGPEAVILSSKPVEEGIEIISAVDYDQTLLQRMLGSAARRPSSGNDRAPAAAQDDTGHREPEAALGPGADEGRAPPQIQEQERALSVLRRELVELRGLVQEQCSRLVWADLRNFRPQRAALLRKAVQLGIQPALAQELVDGVEDHDDFGGAWGELLAGMAARLTVAERDPVAAGGVFALVGPTGVGKTTTVAKLAARHCLQYGKDSLALVSTDGFRVGAQRQLAAFGSILGVPVRAAADPESLAQLLRSLRDKHLVLIDTAGVGPRDLRLPEIAARHSGLQAVQSYLVLAANVQAAAMHEAVAAVGRERLAGCALTKLDESRGLGDALSVLMRTGLTVAWLSNGQRVPEDLRPARMNRLLAWAASPPDAHASGESEHDFYCTLPPVTARRGADHARI